ncbi:MAG: serine O-acetyltransferase [Clostridia bacterium]|nr:serine O-acetyltransferase [Clostridia bacterium]
MIKIQPTQAARRLAQEVKRIVEETKEDVRVIRERDPAAKSDVEVLLSYSGLHAITAHRVSHALYKKEHFLSARLISQAAKFLTGIEIHPGATIGRGLFIDHGTGVVIGETTEIGDNCTLYQGVTLGGTGKETGKRHPTLKDNVMVGAGAKILGAFTIGENSKIAANAVVLCEVPDNCTAVGIPAKVVRRGGERVNDNRDMDQTHIPDPISAELAKLAARIEELERAKQEDAT